jgi:8-oxoguanine deaminase
MAADLACFTLDDLRFEGYGNPMAALVNCGAHHADLVMIAGRWTAWAGTMPSLGIAAMRAAHQASARRVQGGG